jgi:hypothetical protein
MKIVPNGAIQSRVNSLQPMVELSKAQRIPRINPIMI